MVALRYVWGPFKKERFDKRGEMSWHFNAIRVDHTTAHYKLTYHAALRAFKASNVPLSKSTKAHIEHPDMFIGSDRSKDPPVKEGKLNKILRDLLTQADLAECTAMSILHAKNMGIG
jgi:hypothetical protein